MAFFGIQFMTKSGMFKEPGAVYYDESLNADELKLLKAIFTDDVKLEKNVRISAREEKVLNRELGANEFVDEILVPVTDFYETRSDITEFTDGEYEYIPVGELDFTKKLLSVGGAYYLNAFNVGARFRIIKFESEQYEKEIAPLMAKAFAKQWPNKSNVLSMAQTGVTALSRGMNAKLAQVGDAKFFAEKIGDYLASFDLTHTSNEASFSELASAQNICADVRFIDTLTAAGIDIIELTGNHNQDCGDTAAIETIDIYKKKEIDIVGGGKTAEEAAKPLKISDKGNHITFLAYNLSTGGATLDNTPGANQYVEENAVYEINSAKERGDLVIVDIQYYECSVYASTTEDATCDRADSAAGDQVGFFRHLIDLGADIVVGTSAHQPQTFELYGDGEIYYGLGNLWFDQAWWPGTTRSLVLEHYFYKDKLLQTKIVPTIYDFDYQPSIMENPGWFIKRLVDVKP